jgi:hypothetical protein
MLGGCNGSGDDSNSGEEGGSSGGDIPISGRVVKGPLSGAKLSLHRVDLTSPDLKGEKIGVGLTDVTGAIINLGAPRTRLDSGPFLLEARGGLEANGSVPLVPTLSTVVTKEQIENGASLYITPLTTYVVELAKLALKNNPDMVMGSFSSSLVEHEVTAKRSFGVGLLDDVNVFTDAPIIIKDEGYLERHLAYRTSIDILAAVIGQIHELAAGAEADEVFSGLVTDLADGIPDGKYQGAEIASLQSVTDLELIGILTQSPAMLLQLNIPGANAPIAELNQHMLTEFENSLSLTGPEKEKFNEQKPDAPQISKLVPGRDSDGDNYVDNLEDDFPNDPDLIGDRDGDSVDDLVDVFPADSTEWQDTDGDGFGDQLADLYPDDPNNWMDSDGDGIGEPADDQNVAGKPIADAGVDQVVALLGNVRGTIMLSAVGTTDSDTDFGDLSFNWEQVDNGKPTLALDDRNIVNPVILSFPYIQVAGDYVFKVTVTDKDNLQSVDFVTISVEKRLAGSGSFFATALFSYALFVLPMRRRRAKAKLS